MSPVAGGLCASIPYSVWEQSEQRREGHLSLPTGTVEEGEREAPSISFQSKQVSLSLLRQSC